MLPGVASKNRVTPTERQSYQYEATAAAKTIKLSPTTSHFVGRVTAAVTMTVWLPPVADARGCSILIERDGASAANSVVLVRDAEDDNLYGTFRIDGNPRMIEFFSYGTRWVGRTVLLTQA